MQQNIFAFGIVTITCGVLLYVAVADLRTCKIRNEMVLAIAGLFFIFVLVNRTWNEVPARLLIAGLIFVVLLICYRYGMLGGGDVKLLTVAFLWAGQDCAFTFVSVMLVISAVHAGVVYLGVLPGQTINGRRRIAYAPAIAGALVVVLSSGCLLRPDPTKMHDMSVHQPSVNGSSAPVL